MSGISGGPTTPFLLVPSISRAAGHAIFDLDVLDPWIKQVEQKVATQGPYSHFSVLYSPWAPPPLLWDYKCRKCRWWQEPRSCKVVLGDINGNGWCVLWVPPADYDPGTWLQEIRDGEW